MEEQILAVDLSTEQTLEVNLPEQDNIAQIDVYWQDEVTLDLDLSLMYIVSGQREIQDYVDNKSKPEIDEYIELNAKPIVAKVVEQEAKPIIDEYFENTVKHSITEFAEEEMAGYAATATAQVALATEQAGIATEKANEASETAKIVDEKVQEFGQTTETSKTEFINFAQEKTEEFEHTAEQAINDSRANVEKSRIWAEGEQAKVQELGGELSSKGWSLQASNSATSASQSAAQAKTSETNAKSYADSINPATLVNISSNQTITGQKTFTKPIKALMNTVEENTPPTQNQYIDWITPVDKNGANIGFFGITDYADGRRCSRIGHTRTKSDGSRVYPEISVGTKLDGTVFTSAPNPPSGSNGTYIATTSWVNNAGAVVKSKSLANNGYIKFSSGLIIQWGLALNGNLTTFPTPFTSATSWAITTGYCGAGSTDKMWGQIHDRKNTSFDWVAADSSEEMYWIAIGY